MKPILEIRDVWKQYRIGGQKERYLSLRERLINKMMFKRPPQKEKFWALKGIDFDVYPGESIGIIGANGAGKSTLLKILSRITPPTNGQITTRGRVASLLEVGTGFHPELTGRENIFLNGSILGMRRTEINKKYDEIVDFSGVDKFLDTPLKHYSSGMQLRLAFAVAAHLEPEILLIDEILAVGDFEFQKRCLGKMSEVSQSGRTLFFVSHDLAAVNRLSNKVYLLNQGEIAASGVPEEVIRTYINKQGIDDMSSEIDSNVIDHFLLLNSNCEDNSALISGDEIKIKFKLTDRIKYIENIIIRVQVHSSIDGRILFTCCNFHSKHPFNLSNSRSNTIICTIPKLPLNVGQYYLGVRILDHFEVIEDIKMLRGFKVEKGDFFGTGKVPRPEKGMLVNHKWDLV